MRKALIGTGIAAIVLCGYAALTAKSPREAGYDVLRSLGIVQSKLDKLENELGTLRETLEQVHSARAEFRSLRSELVSQRDRLRREASASNEQAVSVSQLASGDADPDDIARVAGIELPEVASILELAGIVAPTLAEEASFKGDLAAQYDAYLAGVDDVLIQLERVAVEGPHQVRLAEMKLAEMRTLEGTLATMKNLGRYGDLHERISQLNSRIDSELERMRSELVGEKRADIERLLDVAGRLREARGHAPVRP